MKFVDVKLRCGYAQIDGCPEIGAEGDETVTTVTLQINGNKAREIDLCKAHREQLVDGVLMQLMRDGRPVESSTSSGSKRKSSKTSSGSTPGGAEGAAPDDLVCRVPGCERGDVPLKNKTGLAQHVIRTHGYADLATYYEETNGT